MSFCGNCGNQLNEGTKFCPKCGTRTDFSTETNAEYDYVSDEEEEIKTWQKVVSVLVWPAGAILTVGLFMKGQKELAKSSLIYTAIGIAITIAFNITLGNCSGGLLAGSSQEYSVASDYDEASENGYDWGYRMGFELGDVLTESDNIPTSYTMCYPAPSTPEEKKQYEAFANGYKKGFRAGKNAR